MPLKTAWVGLALLALGMPLGAQQSPSNTDSSNTDWPEYGGNLAGQRYARQTQLTRTNVHELQPAWTFHTEAFSTPSPSSNRRASFEATPVLWDAALFFDTPFNAGTIDVTNS